MDISKGAFISTFLLMFACVNSLNCGQTVCYPEEHCCEHRKDCCCFESPSGFRFHCASHDATSTGLHWYEVLTIVLVVVGICAGIIVGIVIYRRRRRYTSMS
ncbi:hypothetical protein ACF0H5_000252 [Mactra antiquata]